MLLDGLGLSQLQQHHHDHVIASPSRWSDPPRLLTALHQQRTLTKPPCAMHVVGAAAHDARPVAFLLSEDGHHAGPRFGMVALKEPQEEGRAASRRAVEAVSSLGLETLTLFAVPKLANEAAEALLPGRGYVRVYHNPCVQLQLRAPLREDVLERWRAGVARLEAEGFVLSQLRKEDAELVDSLWPYRSAWSLGFIRDTIIGGGRRTSCVREGSERGPPAAWAVQYEDGSFGMLTTVEAYRRRGLARAVLVALLTQLLEDRRRLEVTNPHPPFCYVAEGNAPSLALLASLGLEPGGVFAWQAWRRRKDGGDGGGSGGGGGGGGGGD